MSGHVINPLTVDFVLGTLKTLKRRMELILIYSERISFGLQSPGYHDNMTIVAIFSTCQYATHLNFHLPHFFSRASRSIRLAFHQIESHSMSM